MSDLPKAYADRDGHTLTVVSCPHCGGRHVHGVGDGPRIAHCGGGSYDLREIPRAKQ